MIEINLIPDVKRELLRTRTLRNFVISISVLVGSLAAGAVVVLALIVGGQIATEAWQDGAIRDANKKMMAVEDLDKSVTLQHQLATIGKLHQEKMIHSRLIDTISAINPPAPNNIQLTALKLDPQEKTLSIEGTASNGYLALEVFKKTIVNTKIQLKKDTEEIRVPLAQNVQDGATGFGENAQGERVLKFAFSFTYPDELFVVSKEPVSIATPTGQIEVTDSKLGVPDSLFHENKKEKNNG